MRLPLGCWGTLPCTELCREMDWLLGSLENQTSDPEVVSVTNLPGSIDNLESDFKFSSSCVGLPQKDSVEG